jgi:5-methyltetrahydropteroyltriglutamate--homocysteine methyltransferase
VGSDRIVVTHAGSLVRPPDLIPFLRAIDSGEPYDKAAHERCLADSVRDVVARQRRGRTFNACILRSCGPS